MGPLGASGLHIQSFVRWSLGLRKRGPPRSFFFFGHLRHIAQEKTRGVVTENEVAFASYVEPYGRIQRHAFTLVKNQAPGLPGAAHHIDRQYFTTTAWTEELYRFGTVARLHHH